MAAGWRLRAYLEAVTAPRLPQGFKSEMLRAGAPADAVDFLQGHVPRGGRGRYIDMERAFDWDQVLGLIPVMGAGGVVPLDSRQRCSGSLTR